jgi:YVTN family beta-propeller protein
MRPPFIAPLLLFTLTLAPTAVRSQTTTGFSNAARLETPGTLLSRPFPALPVPVNGNDSRSLGRTVTINYVNGWLIVGGEAPGSADGSDLSLRVYDISNPTQLVRMRPSHFGHDYAGLQYNDAFYPDDFWYVGNAGWNAHGSAQSGPYLLPAPVMRVQNFGGMIDLGGQNAVPGLGQMPLLYNRSSQAGPWWATMLWYGGAGALNYDGLMEIRRPMPDLNGNVAEPGQLLGTVDQVSQFGGGDWHPMFFGDLLIYARSGAAANGGVVVYRLAYENFENGDPSDDTITPTLVGALEGGFEGYWPNLFSDGNGLHVIGSATDILTSADITGVADPGGNGLVTQGPVLTIPNFTNASYPVYQDQFAFIHNRKINMTEYLGGLGLDAIDLTLDEAAEGIDTSQMSLPLGNLWLTGGAPVNDRDQGMAIWVHQSGSDLTAPEVTYHIPQANRSGYPRFAPLSFLLHEHPRHGGLRNGIDFAVRPVNPLDDSLGAAVEGYLIHDFSGVVTFTPDNGLAAETTYQVDFFSDDSDAENPIGFFDAAGNVIEPYTFRFSTGNEINATTPPNFDGLTSTDYQPEPGEVFTVTASATPGTGAGPLEYRFNFAGAWSLWSENASAAHDYDEAGRYRILVQVRDQSGNQATRPLNLLVTGALTGPASTQSSTLAIGEDGTAGRRLWVVNPDADTVTVLDAATNEVDAELAVGDDPRSIARDANGRYWVTCQGSDEIRVFNPDTTPHATVTVPYGSAPFGIAAAPDGEYLFVTLYGSGRLHRYSAANPGGVPTVQTTFPTPRALAVSGNGERVLVTRFISPDLEGEVGEFHGTTLAPARTFRLASSNTIDNGDRAAGVPNYLAGIAISPDGTRAAVVSKQDNIHRGEAFGVADLTHETSVRAVVSFLDLVNNVEIRHARRDFDNADSPSAVTYTPRGDALLVTLQGNNRLVGIDMLGLQPVTGLVINGATLTSPAVKILDAPVGRAPRGVLVDPVSQRIFTQDFMDRSVTVINGAPLLLENSTSLPVIDTVTTVSAEPLPWDVFLGKQIFYNAADPRMSADSYISCASCHVDGGHDGRVWDFTGRGEGLRRTTDLRGRGGMGHGNVHWSGNFDEIQDFEHDIRSAFGGEGLIVDPNFNGTHPSPATTKAGLSVDLDRLAAYVSSLGAGSVPRSPHRAVDGALTAAALNGREIFVSENCVSCHAGNEFSDSDGAPTLHDVGTLSALSGSRLGAILSGIDTPTLVGLHANREYLHHGGAATLGEVFSHAGGVLLHAAGGQLLGLGGGAVVNEIAFQGGGGEVRGAYGGQFVEVNGGNGSGVRFNGVDGGGGGEARLVIRHILRGNGSTRLVVNGVEQSVQLLNQYPDNGWMTSGWRELTAVIPLNPGSGNVIDVLRSGALYADFQLNTILVANAAVLALAEAHHRVADLSAQNQSDLVAYLRQLDGSPGEAAEGQNPVNPGVTITTSPGFTPPLTEDFIDFDIVFSAPVSGLVAGDFILGGTALPTTAQLTTLTEGTHYRLRVSGFTGAGSITLQLPAGSVAGLGGGAVNNASLVAQIDYAPVVPDDLAPLSDEFDDPDTLTNWLRNETVEGWGGSKLEQWDIATTTPGHMRLMPYASSWYEDFTGAYAYKEVTGDFVLTTRLDVTNRAGTGRPNSDFSLAGLMVRTPRGLTNAAPQPAANPAVMLPWPPPGEGQPNHYTTPWLPDTENYIFLSFGFGNSGMTSPDGNNPNRWHYEVKTTTNGVSTLYPRTHGVPENEPVAMLQMVRRGSTFLLLRRHGEGPWVVENRFERPDLPATVQIGMTTYTDWNTVSAGWDFSHPQIPFHQNRIVNTGGNPDLIADVDFVRIRRPDPSLNVAALQAASLTGPNGPVADLAGTPLAAWLGDNGHAPYDGGGDPEPLPAPENVTVEFIEGQGVQLTWDAVVGATDYEVWSGPDANPESLALLGSSAVSSYLDTTAAPGETRHYAVRATNAIGAGAFSDSGVTSVTIPLPDPRPDLTIGATLTNQNGDGVYSLTGADQRLVLRSKGSRPLAAVVIAGNAGEGSDTILLRSARPPRTLVLSAFLTGDGGRINVTASLTSGGALTGSLVPEESRRLDLSLRPGKRFRGASLRVSGETRGTNDVVLLQVAKPIRKR